MELTVANVYGLLLRSKLLNAEDARAMFTRWQAEGGESSGNVGRFCLWMVNHRYLTEYQAAMLARGHAEGFFLDSYKVLDRLGKGHMAGVYKAIHTSSGQMVAIKVLPPSRARQLESVQRFHREAKLAMRLNHPNVVRVFQLGLTSQSNGDPLHYIVMEYLDGETLDEIIQRRHRLPPPEAVRVVYQALMGLEHIHSQGLVHRDLKPSNLMLVRSFLETEGTPDDTLGSDIKIVDLGLGRTILDSGKLEEEMEDGLTRENTILGTPDYMSPEQSRDSTSIDIRSDIYSLGCVLYQLIAGQVPFQETNLIRLLLRHATEMPRPLQEFNKDVPEGLQQILNWMLAKDPAHRYPTPERAAQALKAYLAAGTYDETPNPDTELKLRNYLDWLKVHGDSTEIEAILDADSGENPAHHWHKTPVNTKDEPSKTSSKSGKESQPSAVVNPVTSKQPTPFPRTSQTHSDTGGKPKESRKSDRHHRENRSGKSSSRQNHPPQGGSSRDNKVDVELVSLSNIDIGIRKPLDFRHLDRRDLLLFALGLAAGGAAVGAGCFFAMKRSRKQPEGN